MSEPDGMTIPIRTERSNEHQQKPIRHQHVRRRSKWTLGRSSVAVLLTAVVVTLGWTLGTYLMSPSDVHENNPVEEIDGFESAAPFIAAPDNHDQGGIILGNASAPIDIPKFEEAAPLPSDLPGAKSISSADVWLTGTIEEDESKDNTRLPTRLSGGPNEISVVR